MAKDKQKAHGSGFLRAVAARLYGSRYFFKRLGVALLTLALTTVLIFLVLRLTPGDTIRNYAQSLQASRNISYEEARKLAVQMLNYDPDAPLHEQFWLFLSGLMRGELGRSMYVESITANKLIAQRLPWTLFVATVSLALSFGIGTWMGSVMAKKRRGPANAASSIAVILSSSIPDYLIGLLLVMAFAYAIPIFPASGHYDSIYTPGFNLPFLINAFYHAFLPIMAFTISSVGGWALLMRSSTIGVLGEDYIGAARARGLPSELITSKYLKKNALLPIVTSLAVSFASMFGGAPLMESIFNYPGIGSEITTRISSRDFFVVQGILFFTSAIMIFANLITDSIYSLIDPRVRKE